MGKEPCKNGGTCSNNICNCTVGFTGKFCDEKTTSLKDKKVIITNKGGYIAEMKLSYVLNNGNNEIPVTQTGSILVGQSYAFYIPGTIDYQGDSGGILTVKAIGGIQILMTKIETNPACYHVWGTTLIPFWSP